MIEIMKEEQIIEDINYGSEFLKNVAEVGFTDTSFYDSRPNLKNIS